MQELPPKHANRTESFSIPWYSPLAVMFVSKFPTRLKEKWDSGELARGILEPQSVEDAGRLWEIRRAIEKKWLEFAKPIYLLLPQLVIQSIGLGTGLLGLFIYGSVLALILTLSFYLLNRLLQSRIGNWEDQQGWPRVRRPYIPGSLYRPLIVLASASKLRGSEKTQLLFHAAKILSAEAPKAVRRTRDALHSDIGDSSILQSQIDVWMRSAEIYVEEIARAILVANSNSTLGGLAGDIKKLACAASESKWNELGDTTQSEAKPRYGVWIRFAILSLSALGIAVLLFFVPGIPDKAREIILGGAVTISGIYLTFLLQRRATAPVTSITAPAKS